MGGRRNEARSGAIFEYEDMNRLLSTFKSKKWVFNCFVQSI